MTISDIDLVIKVAETHNFSEAAFLCNMSQSSLSKHISQLEKELGIKLFDRSTRSVKVTKAGELFVMYGKTIMETYSTMRRSLHAIDKQSIKVGIISRLYSSGISEGLYAFFDQYPDIMLELNGGNTSQLISLLNQSAIDIAIGVLRNDIINNPNFKVFPFAKDEFSIAVSSRHPLAKRKSVSLKELAGESFIALDASSSTSIIINDICKQYGFTPHILHRCADPEIMLDFVCRDKGIAIFVKRIILEIAHKQPELRCIPLDHATYRTIGIITTPPALENRNIQNFIHHILDRSEKYLF